MPLPDTLEGFRVGVTADRRGDDQVVLLERLGARAVRGPALATARAPLDADLRAATEALVADPPSYLVANTGFGIRSWWERAGAWDRAGALSAALAGTRIAARGPKAAGAVRSLGLPLWWRSPTEQLDEVADRLIDEGVAGSRVAVQLHGDGRSRITARLAAAGADVVEVPVYRWELPADAGPAVALIREICDGAIDAVTFTAGPAARRLLELADAEGLAGALLEACNTDVAVVCVGPVCAGVAREEGFEAPAVPEHWRLGSMVTLVGELLAARRLRRDHPDPAARLAVNGGVAWAGERRVDLDGPTRRALARLVGAAGVRLHAGALGAGGVDALTRLRERLGPAGAWIDVSPLGARLLDPGEVLAAAGAPLAPAADADQDGPPTGFEAPAPPATDRPPVSSRRRHSVEGDV